MQAKAWNWKAVTADVWDTPAEDVYYYLNQWTAQGYYRILDLGCGRGRHALLFAQQGFDVAAFDLSQEGLDVLKTRANTAGLSIDIRQGDIHQLPYEDGTFDALLAYHVISHTDTAGIRQILQEVERVLRSGGEFLITFCSKHSPSFQEKKYPRLDDNTLVKTEEPEIDIPHFYTDFAGLQELLRPFNVVRIRHIQDFFEGTSSWHYFVYGGVQ